MTHMGVQVYLVDSCSARVVFSCSTEPPGHMGRMGDRRRSLHVSQYTQLWSINPQSLPCLRGREKKNPRMYIRLSSTSTVILDTYWTDTRVQAVFFASGRVVVRQMM